MYMDECMLNTRSSIQNMYNNVFTCIKQVHLRIFIQAVQKAEEHFLLVTQCCVGVLCLLKESIRHLQMHKYNHLPTYQVRMWLKTNK